MGRSDLANLQPFASPIILVLCAVPRVILRSETRVDDYGKLPRLLHEGPNLHMENGNGENELRCNSLNEFSFRLAVGGSSFTLTILRPIENPSIHSILQDDILHRRIIFSKQLSSGIAASQKAVLVLVTDSLTIKRSGILHRCLPFPNAFELLVLSRDDAILDRDENSTSFDPFSSLSEQSCLENWRISQPESGLIDNDTSGFSMKPPADLLSPLINQHTKVTELSPQNETNLVDFLRSRYFSILYSVSTPLTYFPKTTLARLRNMCGTDAKQMEESLLAVYMSPEALDQRRRLKYGLEPPDKSITDGLQVDKFEADNRRLLIEKSGYPGLAAEAKDKVILDLKRREAQLQLLVIMQLLLTWGIEESLFLSDNLKQQEKIDNKRQKKLLVRRKTKSQKQIVPTLLGVAVHESDSVNSEAQTSVTQYSLFSSLVSLVDQMSIWDVIAGKVKSKKEESMYEFLAFVFVPYFNKKLPNIVRFVIEKVRELRPNFKVPKLKRSKSVSEGSTEASSPALSLDIPKSENEPEKTKPARFNKTLLSKDQKPLLRRAKTSMSEQGDQPAFLLKRSKSNLGSKNLKKRQVDMSLNASEEQIDFDKSSTFIFGDARKIKSQSSFAPPLPKTKIKSFDTELNVSLVLATPSAKRISDVIFETPQSTSYKNGSHIIPDSVKKSSLVQQKLSLLAAPPLPDTSILSSPVNNSSDKSPVLSLHQMLNPPTHDTSSMIASSPVMAKMDPPQLEANPLMELTNPFTKSTLQGSPNRPSQTRRRSLRTKAKPSVEKSKSEIVQPVTKKMSLKPTEQQASKKLSASILQSTHDGDDTDVDPGNGGDTDNDSDSDSDFEKLLASTSNRTLKKYERPKRR